MNTTQKGQFDIVSCGINTNDTDTSIFSFDTIKALCLKADVIFASRVLFEEYDAYIPKNKERRIIAGQARQDAQDALMLAKNGKNILALASGDALYNGFGSTVAHLSTQEDCVIYHPNITAFQSLFHRLALPWAEAHFFSAHYGTNIPLRAFVESPLSVIYGGTQNLVQDIAKAVLHMHPKSQNRSAVIAEKLGFKEEKIVSGSLYELAQMSFGATAILLLLPKENMTRHSNLGFLGGIIPPTPPCRQFFANIVCKKLQKLRFPKGVTPFGGEFERQSLSNRNAVENKILEDNLHGDKAHFEDSTKTKNTKNSYLAPSLALGLSNDFYEKENNLITSPEVRAIALSKLQLPSWGVLWDIGAGSGSVGLESAALRLHLEVHAIEQKQERLLLMKTNRSKLGVHNYFAYHGKAEDIVPTLPIPDRIFIGGGGEQLSHVLEICMEKLKPHGIIVVSAITTESIQILYHFKPKYRHDVCRIDIACEQKIAGKYHHLKPQNTIHLFTFKNEVIA